MNFKLLKATILIFTVSLIIRLVYLFNMVDYKNLTFDDSKLSRINKTCYYYTDSLDYDNLAYNIASGKGYINTERVFTGNRAARPPGYPIFLALIYILFGHNYFIARIAQVIISSIGSVLIFLIAREIFNQRIALLVGIISIVYPFFIYYSAILTSEWLFTMLILFSVLFLIKMQKKNYSLLFQFLSGIFLGLSALTRPIIIPYLPFLSLGFVADQNLRFFRAVRIYLMVVMIAVLTMSPWIIRNALVFKKFIPGTTVGGEALYLSTYPNSDGSPGLHMYDREILRAREIFKNDEIKLDAYFRNRSIAQIINNPNKYLNLIPRHFIKFWNILPDVGMVARLINFFSYGLLLPFFIIGLIKNLRNNYAIFLLLPIFFFTLICSFLFYGSTRLRFPLEPLIVLFASSGIYTFWMQINKIKLVKRNE